MAPSKHRDEAMKRDKASNKATRVARYTSKIASAGKVSEKSARKERLFVSKAKPAADSVAESIAAADSVADPALTRVSRFRDTVKLFSYVNYVIGCKQRDTTAAPDSASRRASLFDFSLRYLDDVPRIH